MDERKPVSNRTGLYHPIKAEISQYEGMGMNIN